MNIVVSGIFYPVTMMQYFINALRRRDDVALWTTGPFFGNWIPWTGLDGQTGKTFPEKYIYTPHCPLPQQAMRLPVHPAMVQGNMPWEADLWLQIDAGWHFSHRPPAKIVALVKTDPHAIPIEFYNVPKAYSDYTFCMQSPYLQSNERYLPYAYDPEIHYPMDLPKEYDACLIGLQYPHRIALVEALRKAGVSVFSDIGIVYDEYRIAYNKSRIALSFSSLQDLPTRVWEYAGMRLPIVTNRVPDLNTFFVEEEHYLGFDKISEAVDQVKWILESDDQGEFLADNAYRKVQVHHTWDARIEQILDVCGLNKKVKNGTMNG